VDKLEEEMERIRLIGDMCVLDVMLHFLLLLI